MSNKLIDKYYIIPPHIEACDIPPLLKDSHKKKFRHNHLNFPLSYTRLIQMLYIYIHKILEYTRLHILTSACHEWSAAPKV